jgi:hypothetical protein
LKFGKYKFNFISFEDLCNNPQIVSDFVNKKFNNFFKMELNKEHIPNKYETEIDDLELLENCNNIYTKLLSMREYINHN